MLPLLDLMVQQEYVRTSLTPSAQERLDRLAEARRVLVAMRKEAAAKKSRMQAALPASQCCPVAAQ